MIVRLFVGTIVAMLACGAISQSRITAQEPSKKQVVTVVDPKEKYSSLGDNWKDKRDFCIRMIDDRVVSRGADMTRVLQIFKPDLFIITGNPASSCTASINFEKQVAAPPAGNRPVAHDFSGWFLWIESDVNGKVTDYYLSNLHK